MATGSVFRLYRLLKTFKSMTLTYFDGFKPECLAFSQNYNDDTFPSSWLDDDLDSPDSLDQTTIIGRYVGGMAVEEYARRVLNSTVSPVREVEQSFDPVDRDSTAKHQYDGEIWADNRWMKLEIKGRSRVDGGSVFSYPDVRIGTAKRYALSEIKDFVMVVIDLNSLEMRFTTGKYADKWITTPSSRRGVAEQNATAIPTQYLSKDLQAIARSNRTI